jgi:hypothetical protein
LLLLTGFTGRERRRGRKNFLAEWGSSAAIKEVQFAFFGIICGPNACPCNKKNLHVFQHQKGKNILKHYILALQFNSHRLARLDTTRRYVFSFIYVLC